MELQLYSTKSVTPEIRAKLPNGFRYFDVCERCGFNKLVCDEKDGWKSNVFYKRYDMILCSECVDKKDGTWNMQIYEEDGVLKVHYPLRPDLDTTLGR